MLCCTATFSIHLRSVVVQGRDPAPAEAVESKAARDPATLGASGPMHPTSAGHTSARDTSARNPPEGLASDAVAQPSSNAMLPQNCASTLQSKNVGRSEGSPMPIQLEEGGASIHSEESHGERGTDSTQQQQPAANGRDTSPPADDEAAMMLTPDTPEQQPAADGRYTSAPADDEANSVSTYTRQLLEAGYERQVPGRGPLRHDTEGWGCLESSFHTLQVGFAAFVLHALHTLQVGFTASVLHALHTLQVEFTASILHALHTMWRPHPHSSSSQHRSRSVFDDVYQHHYMKREGTSG